MWIVTSLILAGLGLKPFSPKPGVAKSSFREALMEYMIMLVGVQAAWMASTTNKRKETNINSGVV